MATTQHQSGSTFPFRDDSLRLKPSAYQVT
jgi:hypothetical protein